MIEGRRKGEAHAARDRTIGRVMLVLLALGVGVVVHSFIRLEIQHLKQRGRRSAAAFNRTSGQWSVGRRPGAGGLSGNVDGGNDNWAGAGEVTSGGAVGSNTGKNPVVLALSQVIIPLVIRLSSAASILRTCVDKVMHECQLSGKEPF